MKAIQVFGYTLVALALTSTTNLMAQTTPATRTDPTYSVHNYKHANKAAVAAQTNPPATLVVSGTNAMRLAAGDYKRVANRDTLSITAAVPSPGVRYVANYKTPHPTLQKYQDRLPAEPKSTPAPPKPGVRPPTGGERPIGE